MMMKSKMMHAAAVVSLLCMTAVPVWAAPAASTLPLTNTEKPVQEQTTGAKKATKNEEASTQVKEKATTKAKEETKKSASFLFTVYLDADISLTQNDTFKITLKDENNETHTVEMNAFESSNSVIESEIDEGTYTVKSIEYRGMNSIITQNGYGMPVQVTLSSKQSTEIPFYIGSQQTSVSGLFVVKNGTSVQTTQNSTEASQAEQDTTAASSTENVVDNTTASVIDPDKEEVVEVVKTPKKKRNTQYIPFSKAKLLPIGIVAILGIASILFYYKKNYKI